MTCGLQAAASAGSDDSRLNEKIPAALREGLMEFQRFGVAFALAHGGRALIADEMGLVRAVPFSARVSQGNALPVPRTGTYLSADGMLHYGHATFVDQGGRWVVHCDDVACDHLHATKHATKHATRCSF